MRSSFPLVLIILATISSLLMAGAEGDNEPNNDFSEAEELKDGIHRGNVTSEFGIDKDVYKIRLHRNEKINISVAILDTGYLTLKGFINKNKEIEDLNMNLFGAGGHDFVTFENGDEPRDIYIQLTGNSDYRLKVDTSFDPLEGFLYDNLDSTLIFLGIVVVIIIITLIVIIFFVKAIRLSISHGFETKECDEGKIVGLVDRRFRHDCMEVLTDDEGVERMMKYEEAVIYKPKQDKNRFRLKQLEDHYYINIPDQSPYISVEDDSTEEIRNEIS